MSNHSRTRAAIKTARESAGMTQQQLSAALGASSRQYVHGIESGRTKGLSQRTVSQIAAALSCPSLVSVDAEERIERIRNSAMSEIGKRFRIALVNRGITIGEAIKKSGLEKTHSRISVLCRSKTLKDSSSAVLSAIAGSDLSAQEV